MPLPAPIVTILLQDRIAPIFQWPILIENNHYLHTLTVLLTIGHFQLHPIAKAPYFYRSWDILWEKKILIKRSNSIIKNGPLNTQNQWISFALPKKFPDLNWIGT